jgi:hypothetical protein
VLCYGALIEPGSFSQAANARPATGSAAIHEQRHTLKDQTGDRARSDR